MTTTYRFGSAELRPGERRLQLNGVDARIGARAFDLLLVLVERRAQLVGKDRLIELVWPRTVVEESNLAVQIASLRKVLGRDAIVTVPGRGYRFCLPVVESSAASAPTLAARPLNNLPLLTAPLFGREADLAAASVLLGAHAVLSIVGPGGIGKTRLGLAAAATAQAQFVDGAWWIELAAIDRAELLPSAVASALGLQLAAGRPALDALCVVLSDQHALLVLDNCEQIAAGVAKLVDTVRTRASGVHFLITSQKPVKAGAERVLRAGALDLPADATPEAAARSPAVALFVDRASAAEPRFTLAPDNVEAVVDVCRRLDGIPLALELAAARVPLLGIHALRARLDQRFKLLTGGAESRPRQQQTLRAALEWSCGLLSVDEQAVLRRLGVFVGGFTLELAQAVVTDERIDEWSALDLLGQLVDKSLVVVELGGGPRYRLLETTRTYSLELLDAAAEAQRWRRRHADAVLLLLDAAQAARWSERPNDDTGIARELDNVRTALDWSASNGGDRSLAIALHAASMPIWIAAGLKAEGAERCAALAPWVDDQVPVPMAAQYWLTVAMMGLFSSRVECFEAAARATALFRQLGDARHTFEALIVRTGVAARRSEHAAASAALAEAEQLVDPAWPTRRRAALAFAAWVAALNAKRHEEAVEHARREFALHRDAGSALGEAIALGRLGIVEINMPGCEAAGEARLRDAAARMAAFGQPEAVGHVLYSLSLALLRRDAIDEALAQARRAYRLLRRDGEQSLMLGMLPLLAVRSGRLEDAARAAGYAGAVYARAGLPSRGLYVEAVAHLQESLPAGDYARLTAEGAALTEEATYALVLDAAA